MPMIYTATVGGRCGDSIDGSALGCGVALLPAEVLLKRLNRCVTRSR